MSGQDETKARRYLGCWQGANEAHIRGDLQRVSNEAISPKNQRISLILNAIWNNSVGAENNAGQSNQTVYAVSGNLLNDKQLLDVSDLKTLSDRRSILN